MKLHPTALLYAAACLCAPAYAACPLAGTWNGKLNLGPASLSIVFHIAGGEEGQPATVALDSPDQGATGIPTDVEYCQGDSIAIQVPRLMLSYNGRLKDDTIKGTFTQMGRRLPLELKRGEVKRNRPQTPRPPFPYSTQELTFPSAEAGITLAGTLTLPANTDKSTPIVVMVTGSGQQNRDEELFGHKPFAVLADALAREGIGSLRYDDRGVGGSTGNPADDTTRDFALDAEGAISYLRSTGYPRVGIFGHSEGGSIAFITATSGHKPDFIITYGAPAILGHDIIVDQLSGQMADMGLDTSDSSQVETYVKTVIEGDTTGTFSSPWMRHFLAYDPAADIRAAADTPTLALYGSKDVQVRPSLNEMPMRNLLPQATVKVYQGLNHLMQPATTGRPSEYSQIDTTIAGSVLQDIAAFINSL